MIDSRRIFIELARSGSFAAVARKLGIARSTVMRRLDALEAELGVVLAQRANRQVTLTDLGARYAAALEPVFDELKQVEARVLHRADEPSGELRAWLPLLGTSAYLAPAITAFQNRYPAVTVHLELGRDIRNLEIGSFDVALQVGFRLNPTLHARTFMWGRLILAASKDYITRHDAPQTLEDLARHTAVREIDMESNLVPWRLPDGERVEQPPASVVVNSIGVAYDLALAGAGITRVPMMLARRALDAGELVQVLPEVYTEEPVSFVFLPDPTPTIRAFLDFIVEWFQLHHAPTRA